MADNQKPFIRKMRGFLRLYRFVNTDQAE